MRTYYMNIILLNNGENTKLCKRLFLSYEDFKSNEEKKIHTSQVTYILSATNTDNNNIWFSKI